MTLPDPILDDLRFQHDLVDEARRRIIRYCPEWTDYNLSDPGITLIELFAWMTEMMVYRLNRVPDRNYVKFLELLGVELQPASSARVPLTFYLSTPFPLAPEDDTVAVVPRGTEVATRKNEEEPEVIFTTEETLTLAGPILAQLRRDDDPTRNFLPRLGIEEFFVFGRRRPQVGATFYLGFDTAVPLDGRILRLDLNSVPTQATGIKREDPPLIWEYSQGGGQWREVLPSTRFGERDSTGGLNNEYGSLTLYLPLDMRSDIVQGREAFWVRCRYMPRSPEQGLYTESPRLMGIQASVLGGSTWATHAVAVKDEALGESDGESGQTFQTRNAPVLTMAQDEQLEVEELQYGEWVYVPWQGVTTFAESTRYDRHYMLNHASGTISFGPAIRQPDGSVKQYGRVPATHRRIRLTQYRYGGGVIGNVPAGKLQLLRTTLPYVDRVTNLIGAAGGRNQELLDEAKLRAQRELRAQERAVTAEDYENLGLKATRAVARLKAITPSVTGLNGSSASAGTVTLLAVPVVSESLRSETLYQLRLLPTVRQTILTYLDRYRLLTTTLNVREPRYLGISVRVEIVPSPYGTPEQIRRRVAQTLYRYLAPLPQPSEEEVALPEYLAPAADGWQFGRDLYLTELYALLQQVPGVRHVKNVRVAYRTVQPDHEPTPDGEEDSPPPDPIALDTPVLAVPPDTLLVSLDHTVTLVAP
jgi:predicted phage baseplate assembly protein